MNLPDPSNAARIVLKTGTLSGIDVLDLGKIEVGASVKLKDGSTATVTEVDGKRLSKRGVSRGSVHVRRNNGDLSQLDSSDITAVLREPA